MTCKDCVHAEICKKYSTMIFEDESLVELKMSNEEFDNCEHFKDRSRFVELPKAHWVRHSPNMSIMREFHKQGIGSGMSENSIFWTCSNCGGWGILSYKYCPFCGAKMEDVEQALKEREENA